ncbi:glycosyltransferase [Scytonema hofmannii PCC 7110]|uniref:Glycosyltransferase n=1 Tax=Scytonema hofmannii PCC 7110 TaxID=128403 RepID=A0A139WYB8_9CYAN|nr:glycosyltransferase [Scytonema hofmannii]KYC37420.1 glycosyltransferase [Scytonema hofmannii PCC 7110]
MRILFISIHFPEDLSKSTLGIYKRMSMFIDAIKALGQLDMLFFVPPETDLSPEAIAQTERSFSQHWQTPLNLFLCPKEEDDSLPKWKQQWGGIFSFFQQSDFFITSRQMQALEKCLSRKPDAIFVHRLSSMSAVMQVQQDLPPIFLDLDDIEHISFMRQIRQPPTRLVTQLYYLQVPARLRGELQAIQLARRTFVCSERDRTYLTERWGLPGVVTISNAIAIPKSQTITLEPTLLMLGGYNYYPNINAANFLIEKVWVQIHKAMPNARLIIAGPYPENIPSYDKGIPGVEFAGFVNNLSELYQRSRVVCCPILSGGGTRVKMVEAAAYGKPIVATRVGSEGLEFKDGQEFLMRDNPNDFAAACLELLRNYDLCDRLGSGARATAIKKYDRANIVRLIQQQIEFQLPSLL